ncbi:uncharacterized protein [Physcomitrium patens]|uniref:DUF7781 domain-containing protein n=1 Tax=Physcomitrium patens TaxID=3218 RepID=A0A7I4D5Z3_PHYPA|nr:uncharacterized protein LOC112279090 isoform X1 [Physcomitrium patens]|eukprot:XP_024368966.1 uncharacterized protein LOC112279090 isoform X1 [Physcomitrella patens]
MENEGQVERYSSRARRAGHASSSARPQGSVSPIRGDTRGFQDFCGDVKRKLKEFYTFDLMPEIFTIKFRQQVEGLKLGANFEFGGMQVNGYSTNDCHTKLVVKPASENNYWKVICEPEQKEIRVLTKKIPLGSILHLQFGIGHDFIRKSTNWNWKVTSTFGLSGPLPEVRQKTLLPIFPGFDINVGWNAQYEHPDLHGASGTGEPPIEVNYGRLHAKIERVAAVYTHYG